LIRAYPGGGRSLVIDEQRVRGSVRTICASDHRLARVRRSRAAPGIRRIKLEVTEGTSGAASAMPPAS